MPQIVLDLLDRLQYFLQQKMDPEFSPTKLLSNDSMEYGIGNEVFFSSPSIRRQDAASNEHWKSEINQQQQRIDSMKRARDAIFAERPITNESNLSETAAESIKRSKLIVDLAYANESKQKIYRSMSELILNEYEPDFTKFVEYSSGTESSQDEEERIGYQPEDMVDMMKQQPSPGELYFMAKIISHNFNFSFRVRKIRSLQRQMPQVDIIATRQNFILCKVNTFSNMREFAIELCQDGQMRYSSQSLTFSSKSMMIDLCMGYDLTTNTPIGINYLEGIISQCLMIPEQSLRDLFDQHISQVRIRLNTQHVEIDKFTLSLVEKQTSLNNLVGLIVLILEDENIIDLEKMSNRPVLPSRLNLIRLFSRIISKYRPSSNHELRKLLTVAEHSKILLYYWHLMFFMKISAPPFILEEQIARSLEIVKQDMSGYTLRSSEFNIFKQIMKLNIIYQVTLLNKDWTQIKQYLTTSIQWSDNFIYGSLLAIRFFQSQHKQSGIKLFNEIFDVRSQTFEQRDDYSHRMTKYKFHFAAIIEGENFSQLQNFDQFSKFYTIFQRIKKNSFLRQMVSIKQLNEKVIEYFKNLLDRINYIHDFDQKIKGIRLFERLLISERDNEIITQNFFVSLQKLQGILHNYHSRKQDLLKFIINDVYYNVLRRSAKESIQDSVVSSLSGVLSKNTRFLKLNTTLTIINDKFDENVVSSKESHQNFVKNFMAQILNFSKNLFQSSSKNDQNRWHNNFNHHVFINELLVSKRVQIIRQKHPYKADCNYHLDQLKITIRRYLHEAEKYDPLLAIIDIDLIEVESVNISEYVIRKRGNLPALIKIIQRGCSKAQNIRNGIRHLEDQLDEQNISFIDVDQIRKMSNLHRNYLQKIVQKNKIITRAEKLYKIGQQFLSQLNSLQAFANQISGQFELPGEQLTDLISNARNTFQYKSMKIHDIGSLIPPFKGFNNEILKCYRFRSFYSEYKRSGQKFTIESVLLSSMMCFQTFKLKLFQMVTQYRQRSLNQYHILFFEPDRVSLQEFQKILTFAETNEEQDMQLKAVFQLFKNAKSRACNLEILIKFLESKFRDKHTQTVLILKQFETKCRQILINEGQYINIRDLIDKDVEILNQIEKFGLNFEKGQGKKFFKILEILVNHRQKIEFFRKLSPLIPQLKQKANEEQMHITYMEYKDLENILPILAEIQDSHFESMEVFMKYINLKKSQKVFKGNFIDILQNIVVRFNLFQKEMKCIGNEGDRTYEQIKGIVINSKIKIQRDEKKKYAVRINSEEFEGTILGENLPELYNNALFLLGKIEDHPSTDTFIKQKKQIIRSFLVFFKQYSQLLLIIDTLFQQGYIFFQKLICKEIKIFNKDISELEIIKRRNEEKSDLWKEEIMKFQRVSPKSTFIQGIDFRTFFDYLTSPVGKKIQEFDEKSDSFEHIASARVFRRFKQKKTGQEIQEDPFWALGLIKQFFEDLNKNESQILIEAEDIEESFVHFCIMPENEDSIVGIQQIDEKRIKNLKFSQILTCTQGTQNLEVKSFIERALQDCNNEYIVLGFHFLNMYQQQMIKKRIDQFIESNNKLRLKICLVGNSTMEELYRYFNLLNDVQMIPQKQPSEQSIYSFEQMIRQNTANVMIVESEHAGMGKTAWIGKQHAKGQIKYFPISGKITEKQLFDRMKSLCESSKKIEVLVIQLHNILSSSIMALNKFLTSLFLFKKCCENSQYVNLNPNTFIYVELENLTNTATVKNNNNEEDIVELKNSIPFLKTVVSVYQKKNERERILKCISKMEFTQMDLDETVDKQLSYVLTHLQFLRNGNINQPASSIPIYQKFQPRAIPEKKILIDTYFFSLFKKNNQIPSLYSFKFFKKLLFEGCKAFTKSLFLKFDELKINGTSFNVRGQFLTILVENAFDFLVRSVSIDEFNIQNHKKPVESGINQKLKQFPFFIIPNCDGQSFSFIYTKPQKVPSLIQKMIVNSDYKLKQQAQKAGIEAIFARENLKQYQLTNQEKFKIELNSILRNISGNNSYDILVDPSYVVNLDNFFKACLITLRMRQSIPIVIMGEAGIGKTALIKHVVKYMFKHDLEIFNVHTGISTVQIQEFIAKMQTKAKQIQKENKVKVDKYNSERKATNPAEQVNHASLNPSINKKLWVFLDEFNTTKEIGYFKELIMEGKFMGVEKKFLSNVVLIAACNPYRALLKRSNLVQQELHNEQLRATGEHKQKLQRKKKLAFDVLPVPHSLIECMWNYGSLKEYENKKYIKNMIKKTGYRLEQSVSVILKIHSFITSQADQSAVSLRDIDRFRIFYGWFYANRPKKNIFKDDKVVQSSNYQERAFIMAIYFCYILRFHEAKRQQLQKLVEEHMQFSNGRMKQIKQFQETDFSMRFDTSKDNISMNRSIKQNLFTCFVSLMAKMPMIIIGGPGCSKSLSIRLITRELYEKRSENDEYIKTFPYVRVFNIQGSEICTANEIKQKFELARKHSKQSKDIAIDGIPFILFDEIGLAQKSKDNPLKILHQYLEVTRDIECQDESISFVGISNTDLDLSKMSRMLLLRRPEPDLNCLKTTATEIAAKYPFGHDQNVKYYVKMLTSAYVEFMKSWKLKQDNDFGNLYGLRDFYSMIKTFMKSLDNKICLDLQKLIQRAENAIFKNFSGRANSFIQFKKKFMSIIDHKFIQPQQKARMNVKGIIDALQSDNQRFPLAIVDIEGANYLSYLIQKKFKNPFHVEGSEFKQDINNVVSMSNVLVEIAKLIEGPNTVVFYSLNDTIKTSLYEFFNKFFIDNEGPKQVRIKTQSSSNKSKKFNVHKDFNCVYIISSAELEKVELPFLSRFQKHYFTINELIGEVASDILARLSSFFSKIDNILSKLPGLAHFKTDNIFANFSSKNLQTIVMKLIVDDVLPEQIYNQAIRVIMKTSSIQFSQIFKYYIERNCLLQSEEIRIIREALDAKQSAPLSQQNFMIVFTSDGRYNRFAEVSHEAMRCELDVIKCEEDLPLRRFFQSNYETLYINLNKSLHMHKINYLISLVERMKTKTKMQGLPINDKKVYIVLDLNRIEALDQQLTKKNNQTVLFKQSYITFLTLYGHIYDEGSLSEVKNDRNDFFKKLLAIDKVFLLAKSYINFSLKDEDTINPDICRKVKESFELIFAQIFKKNGMLARHAQDVICQLEMIGYSLSEEKIKELLMNPANLTKFRNFKESTTFFLAQGSIASIVAFWLKFLNDRSSLISYSRVQIFKYFKVAIITEYPEQLQISFNNIRGEERYMKVMDALMKSRMNALSQSYKQAKNLRRQPSLKTKVNIQIGSPRFFPFSQGESNVLFDTTSHHNFSVLAHNIMLSQNQTEQENIFLGELKKKSTFSSAHQKSNSIYLEINKNPVMKRMLFLDILSDFLDAKSIPKAYILSFEQIMIPFFSKKDNRQMKVSVQKMFMILLAYNEIWAQIFKIFSIFYEEGFKGYLPPPWQPSERVFTKQSMDKYCAHIALDIKCMLTGKNVQRTFDNQIKYERVLSNVVFQMERLNKMFEVPLPEQLRSLRDFAVFFEAYDESQKQILLAEYLSLQNFQQTSVMLRYLKDLKENASDKQKMLIAEFEANNIFLKWAKSGEDTEKFISCLTERCNDPHFAHNSVTTVGNILSYSEIQYQNLNFSEIIDSLSQRIVYKTTKMLAQMCAAQRFEGNLSILITNIFMNSISTELKKLVPSEIIKRHTEGFLKVVEMYKQQINPFASLFALSIMKSFLTTYVERLMQQDGSREMVEIDKCLTSESTITKNLRFYCLKLMRKIKPLKELKQLFIQTERVKWVPKMSQMFTQEQSRSIFAPNEAELKVTAEMTDLIAQIAGSHGGKTELFATLFKQAERSPQNRYALLNFFFRFYYTITFNQKEYRNKVISALEQNKAKFAEIIGQIEFNTIVKYASSNFSDEINLQDATSFNEETFIRLNGFNWLLATRFCTSPLHSLFFKTNGQIHEDLVSSFNEKYFPLGPESPFISNAQNVIDLSRNNDIGIYICCKDCDYIYTHHNCGWPSASMNCPMCGKVIGSGGGHKISRANEGGRRLVSTQVKDGVSIFYAYNNKVAVYWDAQRAYVQAEINCMKLKKCTKIGERPIVLTGYVQEQSSRFSTFTYKFMKMTFETMLYGLLTLNAIPEEQCLSIFKGKGIEEARVDLHKSIGYNLGYIKTVLNLDNKVYGWVFGAQKKFFKHLMNFRQVYSQYAQGVKDESDRLAARLRNQIATKACNEGYFNCLKDMANTLDQGLTFKWILKADQISAENRFARDLMEKILQNIVRSNNENTKFGFAQSHMSLQGKMQFPFDSHLLQDKVDTQNYSLAKVFKIPDNYFDYDQLLVRCEIVIKERYPFLNFMLKGSAMLNSIKDFHNVVAFCNAVSREVENTYERTESEMSLEEFISEVTNKKGQNQDLNTFNAYNALNSWNRLAKNLGELQNGCTPLGRMSDQFSMGTPIKGFILDNKTKENPLGLMISPVFHSFAVMHNELTTLLNSRKNLIVRYKRLTLYNDLVKLHPQHITYKCQSIFIAQEEEFKKQLSKNSICSVVYGQNMIFNNFQALEDYFVIKLNGKCQIIDAMEKYTSVCYNGEAFSKNADLSIGLQELREQLDEKLTQEQRILIGNELKKYRMHKQNELRMRETQSVFRIRDDQSQQFIIQLRGDLERTMLLLGNKLLAINYETTNLKQFIESSKIDVNFMLKQPPFGDIFLNQIVSLFEALEDEMRVYVIKKIDKRYKEPIEGPTLLQVETLLKTLRVETAPEDEESPVSCRELASALYRFTARILQSGTEQPDKKIMDLLPYRADFWPSKFKEDTKLEILTQNEAWAQLPLANVCHLLQIVQKFVK